MDESLVTNALALVTSAKPQEEDGLLRNLDELDDSAIREVVASEFKCMICLQVMKKTMTVKECLHRFCNDCIQGSLRHNKYCPLCKVHLPSRRYLREDRAFDALIEALHGDPEKHRAEVEQEGEEWWEENKSSFHHLGEAWKKQKLATKGRRVVMPKIRKEKRGPGRPSSSRDRQGQSAHVARQDDMDMHEENEDTRQVEENLRKFLQQQEARSSEKASHTHPPLAQEQKEQGGSRGDVGHQADEGAFQEQRKEIGREVPQEQEQQDLMVILCPAGEGEPELKQPFVVASSRIKFRSIRKLVEECLQTEVSLFLHTSNPAVEFFDEQHFTPLHDDDEIHTRRERFSSDRRLRVFYKTKS